MAEILDLSRDYFQLLHMFFSDLLSKTNLIIFGSSNCYTGSHTICLAVRKNGCRRLLLYIEENIVSTSDRN